MFVILFYDINQKRCGKALKICRKYLKWVQNSVFEGEISDSGYANLVFELNKIVRIEDNDSIIAYKFRKMKYYERKVYGVDKKKDTQFL